MKLVIIEPLGVEKEQLLAIAEEKLKTNMEIVCYDTRVTDSETLIQRGKDADAVSYTHLDVYKRQGHM